MEGITVLVDKCVGCKLCIKTCPYDAIDLIDKKAVINDRCTLCGACVEACHAYGAIVIEGWEPVQTGDLSVYNGIAVFVEHRHGKLVPIVPEIIGAALELREQSGVDTPVTALLIGSGVTALAQEVIEYGVDEVWLVDDPQIHELAEDTMGDVAVQVISEKKPAIVLGGGTVIGRSLLPSIASRLRTGLTADCTELTIDAESGLLRQTRPAFGGNIMATILCENSRPQMATVRHKVMNPAQRQPGRAGTVVAFDTPVQPSRFKMLEFVSEEASAVNLADAEFIVSGGRGLGEAGNFSYVERLSSALGGAVGASRAAVDAGWIQYSHQVGQTGKTVKPQIYVACGISGAIQHQVGMKSADMIIAINNDPDAPIFSIAHYGIQGDLFEVIPELVRQLNEAQ